MCLSGIHQGASSISAKDFDELIAIALREDLGADGDITSRSIFSKENGEAVLVSKDTGVLAGSIVFESVYGKIDTATEVRFNFRDGDAIQPGMAIATVRGKIESILSAERVSLNFLSFLSGIATLTSVFVRAAKESGRAIILDTRKTLPGFRVLSKYAVRMGGGENHRMGLFDMILIKDNHVDACSGIPEAVSKARAAWGNRYKIEVECRTLDEVNTAVAVGADIVMLDNMDDEQIRDAVKLASGKTKIEASGQMDLERVRRMSSLGVDYISVGMITKSVKAFDFSLDIIGKQGK